MWKTPPNPPKNTGSQLVPETVLVNGVFKSFYLFKKSCKNISWFPQKILSTKTVFNMDNNKNCFPQLWKVVYIKNTFDNFWV